jgi:hypothetical protein
MPGLRGPLSVRVSDGETDRIVSRYVRGLKFTKMVNAGHHELTFTMTPPQRTFRDLGPQDGAWVYDDRTGATVFGKAYLENPTPVDGPLGQRYDVRAVGGAARANDESRALVYVDSRTDAWTAVEYGAAAEAASASTYQDPTVAINSGWQVQLTPGGTPVATNQVAAIDYRAIHDAGMGIAGVRVVTQSGKPDSGWRTELYDFVGSAVTIADPAGIQTGAFDQSFWIGADLDSTDIVLLQLRRSGTATNVADDTTWTKFLGLSVLGRRYDRWGNLLGTAAAHGNNVQRVLSSQVVEDLLGRLLAFCDPATARVDPTTFAIDQLAFSDGVKAAGVLNELVNNWETDHWWGIHETQDNGLHRFGFQEYGTEARYEVSVKDGWIQSGSDVDLCNRILVTFTDSAGKTQTEPVHASDPDVDLAGKGLPVDDLGDRVKDADPITLPDGFGSLANARRIGREILRDAISPPKAGRAVVRRPIIDQFTGNEVLPHQLEPGSPVRVRETDDQLRCTQGDYDDEPTSMTLTLGTPVLTREQRLARLDAA